MKLSDVLNSMRFGQTFICTTSRDHGFTAGKTYSTRHDDEGYVYISDDKGNCFYTEEDSHGVNAGFVLQTTKPQPLVSGMSLKEKEDMTPSKVKEVINRLNGVKPGTEKLVGLRQVSSTKATFELDLAHMLANSPAVKELKPGEDSLVTGLDVDLHNGKVQVHLSKGKVEREETSAVTAALTDLVANHKSEAQA